MIPARRRAEIERATALISGHLRLSLPALALFAIGPIPKASLFMAAGVARMNLLPGAAVYAVGRLAIYAVTLTAAGTAASSLREIVTSPVGGPLMIAGQLASVAGTVLLFRVDWARLLRRVRSVRGAAPATLAEAGALVLPPRLRRQPRLAPYRILRSS
jgi:hypothetical protein